MRVPQSFKLRVAMMQPPRYSFGWSRVKFFSQCVRCILALLFNIIATDKYHYNVGKTIINNPWLGMVIYTTYKNQLYIHGDDWGMVYLWFIVALPTLIMTLPRQPTPDLIASLATNPAKVTQESIANQHPSCLVVCFFNVFFFLFFYVMDTNVF